MIPFALETAMPGAETYIQFIPILLLVVLFYVLLIRPQRKREKADREMRDSIVVGDRICTIGGMIGRVVSISDDVFVVETGSNNNRIKMYRWAIRSKVDKDNTEEGEGQNQ